MATAKVVTDFNDLREGVLRHAGDAFEVSVERFAEITRKLPGYVELVADKPTTRPKQAARSTRGRAAKDG